MKCPAELACELRALQFRDGRGPLSGTKRNRLWLEVLYFALCRVLVAPPRMKGGREPAIEIALAETLLVIAPIVGDPRGVHPLCAVYLHFVDLLCADDSSVHLTDAAAATVAAALHVGLSANRVAEFRRLCSVAARRRQQAAQSAELDTLAAEVEAGMERFEAMSSEQQRRFSNQVSILARRSRRFAHPPKLPSVPPRLRRGRARQPARRTAHRPSPRRAETDSGGDGDGDGPGDGEPPHVARRSWPVGSATNGHGPAVAIGSLEAGGTDG